MLDRSELPERLLPGLGDGQPVEGAARQADHRVAGERPRQPQQPGEVNKRLHSNKGAAVTEKRREVKKDKTSKIKRPVKASQRTEPT